MDVRHPYRWVATFVGGIAAATNPASSPHAPRTRENREKRPICSYYMPHVQNSPYAIRVKLHMEDRKSRHHHEPCKGKYIACQVFRDSLGSGKSLLSIVSQAWLFRGVSSTKELREERRICLAPPDVPGFNAEIGCRSAKARVNTAARLLCREIQRGHILHRI